VGILYGDTIVHFDPTVSWGTVITVLTFLGAMLVWAFKIGRDIQGIHQCVEERLDKHEKEENKKHLDNVERLTRVEERVDSIREYFVKRRRERDGES
jgi:low affinity Fe/Cu permease